MNIIFVSNNMTKARTLTLGQGLLLLAVLLLVPPLVTAALILPQPGNAEQPGVNNMLPVRLINAIRTNPQEHLNALAMQLGQIQARVLQLDALSAQLARVAGIKEAIKPTAPPPGQGGPLVQAHSPSAADVHQQLAELARVLDERSDQLSMLEAMLLQRRLDQNTLPSGQPIGGGIQSSGFGWRVDPITGAMALHEGLDYVADNGTPIYAAAAGIVAQAEKTPDYGNIVKLDHGAGLETRYAHASRLLVKVGERVDRGQPIAEVGNSGRSTGAHLHFEVRLNGVALDPRKYLKNRNG